MSLDPTSFGNISQVRQKHLHLDLNVNFNTSQLQGFVEITVECLDDADVLVLDTSALTITAATNLGDNASLKVCEIL
jgi:aminopeptidase N